MMNTFLQLRVFFPPILYINRCNGLAYYLQAALLQHCNRALYQSSIWATSLQNQQNAPLPDRYGWQIMNTVWVPVWTLLPEVAKASSCAPENVDAEKLDFHVLVYANVVENVTFLAKI